MIYNDAARKLKTVGSEKTFIGEDEIFFPIIAPELEEDILKFLDARAKQGDRGLLSVFNYSSNNSFSIIWINENTYSDYKKD